MSTNTKAQNDLENYEEQNPLLTCKCGRKFRQHGIDRNGNKRTYTKCMNCFQEDFKKQVSAYESTKDATESEDINF